MNSLPSTQQFQDLLSFPFRDPQWKKKLLIGGFLTMAVYTIVLGPLQFLVMGYYFRIMKHIIVEDGEPYLPEWDNWGQLFIDGLRITIPGFFFTLPGVLLMFLAQGGAFLSMASLEFSNGNYQFLEPVESLLPLLPVAGMLFFCIFFGIGFILILTLGFLNAPAICHVVASDKLTGAFKINEWWRIFRANILGFLLALLVMFCLSFAMTFVTQMLSFTIIMIVFIPIVGSFIGVYTAMIYYVLIAQAYTTGKKAVVSIV